MNRRNNIIIKKMRSGKGASITFALLLFLVCAVLCSVILAAATTASGRMAGIAETDQRYYSVTSASGLLRDLLSGKSASAVKVTSEDSSETYVFGFPAYEVDERCFDPTSDKYSPPVNSETKFEDIAQAAVYKYVTTDWKNVGKDKVDLGTYELSSDSVRVDGKDPLKVTVKAEVDKKGNVIFTAESIPDKRDNRFKQRIFFSGTVTEDSTSVTREGPIEVEGATTLTWTMTSVTAI